MQRIITVGLCGIVLAAGSAFATSPAPESASAPESTTEARAFPEEAKKVEIGRASCRERV